MITLRHTALMFAVARALLLATPACAQASLSETFNTSTSSGAWTALGGACLTAGTYAASAAGSIPGCTGNPYYKGLPQVGNLPDTPGNGALRLTDGYPNGFNQSGAVLSTATFPNSAGVHITFKTVTYAGYTVPYKSGGVQYGTGNDGADGLSFMLLDGSVKPTDIGAVGGALSYSCANTQDNLTSNHPDGTRKGYDGVPAGYLGLGIDEFGNFLNQAQTTATGYGYVPNRIGVRGAGSVSWESLHARYPAQYPSALYTMPSGSSFLSDQAVSRTCASGYLWDYSPLLSSPAGKPFQTTTPVADYAALPNAYSVLKGVQIANEAAQTRDKATPITYTLDITQDGYLSVGYSVNGGAYQTVLPKTSIVATNGTPPATFRFGFAGSTGGSTNVHEVLCFQATPSAASSSSTTVNQLQSGSLRLGTQVYFAYYNPLNWSGALTASTLGIDALGNVVLPTYANWDASCVLSGVAAGGTCPTTNGGSSPAQAPASRTILTAVPQGTGLEWSNLPASLRTALDMGDATPTDSRLQFLRGDRSNEITALGAGVYRARASVLGDIIDSGPTLVGPPGSPYNSAFTDLLDAGTPNPEAGGQSYAAFAATYASRQNVVYVGANDGLLHGFRAGAYDASGNFVANASTPNDGLEVLAYMPPGVLASIHDASNSALDYASPQYGHAYSVDGTPGTGDLYYGGTWHTWLVGGLGAGGAEIYALDVTDPSTFSEGNARSLVIGDWTPANLSCRNATGCGAHLGNTYGVPQIRRFHNGQWGIVFGNGLGSAAGDAGIYILLFGGTPGAPATYYLPAPAGVANNGITSTSPVDLDGDHITDYIYAGDLAGNVWRFDVTDPDPGNWASAPSPLYTTPGQPITTRLLVAAVPSLTTPPRVMVAFGTGQQTPLSLNAPAGYAPGQQSLYGVWDWNLSAWNARSKVQYAALAGPVTITPANLQAQSVTGQTPVGTGGGTSPAYRTVSNLTVCWYGTSGCGGAAGQFGWMLPLPGTNEQIIYSPSLIQGRFVVNTQIPAPSSPLDCNVALPTGWTMAIDISDGGRSKVPAFVATNQSALLLAGTPVSGVQSGGVGTLVLVNNNALVTQTVSDVPTVIRYNPGTTLQGSRITWIEKR